MAAEKISRVLHLTESLPLSVYNKLFSRQPQPNGQVVYYDATQDDYFDKMPLSACSEIKIPEEKTEPLFKFN